VPGRPLTVLKLGGSVLRSERDLAQAVHEVYRWAREGPVVAVVSALRGTTDGLIAQAERVGPRPQPAALAALVATGEQAAAALMVLALDRAGLPAEVLDAARLGLRTRGALLEADPVHLETGVLDRVLGSGAVAVVPGFLGRTVDGAISLLGRGGSDYTAVFLADRLRAARCRLIKDTDGLYDRDPARQAGGRRYASLSWDDALRLGGGVVQPRALRFARSRRLEFEVGTWRAAAATRVGPGPARLAIAPTPPAGPARVALLGLGTVGLGVYRLLEAQRDLFEVVGIAVRDPRRHAGEAPASLLTTDARALVDAADVVVEAIVGEEPAAALARRALAAGKAVISANKALVAAHGPELARLAAVHGGALRFSAAVGGAVPVLETAARLAATLRLRSVVGVLNGTTGFVLDRMAEGHSLEEAVRRAQARGLAEADPSRDLEGIDLEAKLRVLARVAFGREARNVARRGVVDVATVKRSPRGAQGRVRLVGRLEPSGRRLLATVAPERLPASHPLAGLRDEQNGVVFHVKGGPPVVLRGRGAGRWPTAEAVVADLLELARERPAAEVGAADGVSA
jgi:homoserine dehydrogenase